MNRNITAIVYVGVLTAIIIVSTFIKIPLPTGSMVHLGSAALFTTSVLFGGIYGGLGAAIGSALFDILAGKMAYTAFSIVIKGIAGLLVGYFTVGLTVPKRNSLCPSYTKIFIAIFIAAIWTAFGYFLAWWYVLGSSALAFMRLPASFLSSGVGLLVAIILIPRLYNRLRFMRPDR